LTLRQTRLWLRQPPPQLPAEGLRARCTAQREFARGSV